MLADEKGDVPTISPQALGGHARREALDAQTRADIARKAALVKWATPQATHEGTLDIGGIKIPCAVLPDGTRLLSRAGFIRAIGRRGKAKGGRKYDRELEVPVFLTAENLQPFVPQELTENSKPLVYRPLAGGSAVLGYRYDLLPLVCNVFLDAREAGALHANQIHIADQCRILSRGFAAVGLAALIDEATGFEAVRDRLALQRILDAYLSRELAAWAKRFPDDFYKEIFRLRGWAYEAKTAKERGKGYGPRVIAKYTNDFVYARLAPGILDQLKVINPADERGRRKAKHHQHLTFDIGHPALAQHLHAVIGLMRASDSWEQFKTMLDRVFPRRTDLSDLPLFAGNATSHSTAM